MSNQQISKSLHSATSLQASEGGVLHCSLQGGTQADLSGQEARHANHSQQQETEKDKMMSDTYGQSSLISLESASLQQSLASRLQQQLGQAGSTIYKLTWKQKTTPRQWPYCRLAASAHRTSVTDSGTLLSAWPTPMAADNRDRGKWSDPAIQRRVRIGKSIELSMLVGSIAAWPTPTHHNAKENGYPGELSRKTVPLGAMRHIISGTSQKSSTAETESTAQPQLNPRFSLWLMGYPIEWAYCAERVTPSSRKRRQK